MAEANELARAKTVYEDLCAALTNRGWRFERHDDDLVVTFSFKGDDLPMDYVLVVDADRQLLRMFSSLPFTVPEDKRIELAIATTAATDKLLDGCFDYDFGNGKIVYRMTASFRDSVIGDGLFEYLVEYSNFAVDEYNDKFFAIGQGYLQLTDFLAKI